jgi:hypothetical protein
VRALDHSIKVGVGDDAWDAAALGHRFALHLLDVSGEIDGTGTADVATHAEAIHQNKGAATQLRPLARHPSRSQSSPYRRRVVLLRSNVS